MKFLELVKDLKELKKDIILTDNIVCDCDIIDVSSDSRSIKSDYCFVAVKGFKSDGHLYIEKAIENGAKVIVVENLSFLEKFKDYNVLYVSDSRKALAYISKIVYGNPSENIKLIGVTGTNGKTSISNILNDMLKFSGYKTSIFGTIKNIIDDKEYESKVTTPESYELNQMFSLALEKGVKYSVMEVSSHALSLDRVLGLEFDVAIFTNLTEDHLDFHEDFEDYYNQKRKLFEYAKYGIVNIDDEYGKRLKSELDMNHITTISLTEKADIMAKNIVLSENGSEFTLITNNINERVKIKFQGKIYIYNVLLSIGAMLALGFKEDGILKSLSKLNRVRGRLEKVSNSEKLNIIVDYAHTPDALDNVISIAKEYTKGRVIVVFGCGGDRDKAKRPIMGNIATEKSDFAIITSDNPRSENPNSIIDDIRK